MAPATLQGTDIEASCSTGLALGPVLGALGLDGRRPYKAMTFTRLAAGMCADIDAWEAELVRLRSLHAGQGSTTRDQLIIEQRIHAEAAERYYAAWSLLDLAFPDQELGEDCPRLSTRRREDLLLLLGLTSGALAMVHDRAAEGAVGVPTDLPRKVERAAACLDDDEFWGVPGALRASVWALVPGAAPEGVDPWSVLSEAAAKGETDRVRLGRALQIQALATVGETEQLKQAIRDHAAALDDAEPDPSWALLDSFGTALIRHESDKLWMSSVGHRTPLGALGTFADDPSPADALDPALDGILDSILGSEPTDAPDMTSESSSDEVPDTESNE